MSFNASPKPSILILGVYHMANPGLDVVKTELDDHLSDKRQKEIKKLVEHLKPFKPTKIAIESPFGSKTKIEQYHKYLNGDYTLTTDEIDQIGFRLGKALNHKTLYPIDYQKDLGFKTVWAFLKENGQADVIAWLQKEMENTAKEQNELIRNNSVIDILRQMNTQENIEKSHRPYLEIAKIGKGPIYVGADLVANWYERNIKIFSNLTRIVTSKNDRILVIFGQGHVKILQELIRDSQDFILEYVNNYL